MSNSHQQMTLDSLIIVIFWNNDIASVTMNKHSRTRDGTLKIIVTTNANYKYPSRTKSTWRGLIFICCNIILITITIIYIQVFRACPAVPHSCRWQAGWDPCRGDSGCRSCRRPRRCSCRDTSRCQDRNNPIFLQAQVDWR